MLKLASSFSGLDGFSTLYLHSSAAVLLDSEPRAATSVASFLIYYLTLLWQPF